MIIGTNAYCKLKEIKVTENIATITLLIFATQSTVPAKSFRICLKEEDGLITYADNNTYWIDQVNNYNYDSNNVDTKKHKEIMLSVDISRSNTSDIQGNRWVRNCYIYLIDASKNIDAVPAWSSGLLHLISDDFEIPEIKNVSFDTTQLSTRYVYGIVSVDSLPEQENAIQNVLYKVKVNDVDHYFRWSGREFYEAELETELCGKIKTKFTLHYNTEKDFNYNNDNFSALLNIRSVATNNILETKEIATSSIDIYNEIETTQSYLLGNPIIVQLLITNKNGDVLKDIRKIYKPIRKYSNGFLKTDEGIKRILAFFVNTDTSEEHEGEWL